MTCIVNPAIFKSKKALEELANVPGSKGFTIIDPSIFAPRTFNVLSMEVGQTEVVTNHPARSKFAKITRTATGIKVS